MVLARSYNTQLTTARVGMTLDSRAPETAVALTGTWLVNLMFPAVLDPALHDVPDPSKRRDVFRRVAINGNEIRQESFLHLPDARVHVQDASGDGRRALQRGLCRHAVVVHQLDLAGVVAVRKDADVAAAQDRHPSVEGGLEA